jgi:hypothetical protein
MARMKLQDPCNRRKNKREKPGTGIELLAPFAAYVTAAYVSGFSAINTKSGLQSPSRHVVRTPDVSNC